MSWNGCRAGAESRILSTTSIPLCFLRVSECEPHVVLAHSPRIGHGAAHPLRDLQSDPVSVEGHRIEQRPVVADEDRRLVSSTDDQVHASAWIGAETVDGDVGCQLLAAQSRLLRPFGIHSVGCEESRHGVHGLLEIGEVPPNRYSKCRYLRHPSEEESAEGRVPSAHRDGHAGDDRQHDRFSDPERGPYELSVDRSKDERHGYD